MTKAYVLTAKLPAPGEVHRDCLNEPEEIDADLHLRSLVTDIEGLPGVLSVNRDGFVMTIRVDEGITQPGLKAAMKPFFAGNRFCKLRFASLEPFSA